MWKLEDWFPYRKKKWRKWLKTKGKLFANCLVSWTRIWSHSIFRCNFWAHHYEVLAARRRNKKNRCSLNNQYEHMHTCEWTTANGQLSASHVQFPIAIGIQVWTSREQNCTSVQSDDNDQIVLMIVRKYRLSQLDGWLAGCFFFASHASCNCTSVLCMHLSWHWPRIHFAAHFLLLHRFSFDLNYNVTFTDSFTLFAWCEMWRFATFVRVFIFFFFALIFVFFPVCTRACIRITCI